MDRHQELREKVAKEYNIALYRRYREKQAAKIVGYEAKWWKRHRKAGTIPYIQDPGGGIGYFGYMLVDLLILGKAAVNPKPDREEGGAPAPATPTSPPQGGPGIAAKLIRGDEDDSDEEH